MSKRRSYIICMRVGDRFYKISKLVFYNDKGFAFFCPYIAGNQGLLLKFEVDYAKKTQRIFEDEVIRFTAQDKVKLSYHYDGFVQFSGVNPSRIISGRDLETGKPKGLGIFSQPLSRPVSSGPSFGLVFWGLEEFDQITLENVSKINKIVGFRETDCTYRGVDFNECNGYLLEGFVVLESFRNRVITRSNGTQWIGRKNNSWEIQGDTIPLAVVPDYENGYFIGLMISRIKLGFDTICGFTLGGPTQLINSSDYSKKGIQITAVYPIDAMPQFRADAEPLDYLGRCNNS